MAAQGRHLGADRFSTTYLSPLNWYIGAPIGTRKRNIFDGEVTIWRALH